LPRTSAWALPECDRLPMGGGTGLIGMWKAFAELEEMGMLGSARPRMIGVQVEGFCACWCARSSQAEAIRTRAVGRRYHRGAGVTCAWQQRLVDFLGLEAISASGAPRSQCQKLPLFTRLRPLRGHAMGPEFLSLESAARHSRRCRSSGVSGAVERATRWSCSNTGCRVQSTLPELRRDDP